MSPNSIKPAGQLKLKCSEDTFKNWPLGHGLVRASGNLGPLIPIVSDAKQNGFDDVLWLLDDYIKELTVLNIFVLWKSRFGNLELVTPITDGTIFNGVTRRSIVELKDQIQKETGAQLIEKQISIHEVKSAFYEKRLIEVFGGATSSQIKPISTLVYKDHVLEMHGEYKMAKHISQKLVDIKTGSADHPWVVSLE